jgi:itaconate CoA-transferase
MLPLDGITVVSLEQAVAAPFCTRQLADLGARVIKIERPEVGDFARSYDENIRGMSAYFVWLNRGKQSLTLDLKHERARDIMLRLIARADVFIQNLAPGAAERLGLGSRQLVQQQPRLIACDISGYGSDGPYRDKKAYDLLIQAEAGVMSVTGTPESPARVGISIVDICSGTYAYSGILTALYQREKTGKGDRIEVSMFEALGEWMTQPLYYTHYTGKQPRRSGPDHSAICPYGVFRAADGKSVMMGIQNEREWAAFCAKVLLRPELARDARFNSNSKRLENREALLAELQKVLDVLTAEQLTQRLDEASIANSRQNEVQDVWDHPQLKARSRWREMDTPVGKVPALLPPATHAAFEANIGAVPAVGEHTDAILREAGIGADEIARLRAAGAV